MSKKLVYVLAITIIALGAVGYTSAQQMMFHEKLAERFNLDPDEVQEFLEENRVQMETQKMGRLVENARITEEQKELILEKKEQLREDFGCLRDMEPEERQERMEEMRQEMKQWAEENDIPLGFLMRRGAGKSHGLGMRGLRD